MYLMIGLRPDIGFAVVKLAQQMANPSNDHYQVGLHLCRLSQTSFGHISINSSTILTVSMAMESPWKDLLINTSHILKQSVLAEILGRSTGNYHGTVY